MTEKAFASVLAKRASRINLAADLLWLLITAIAIVWAIEACSGFFTGASGGVTLVAVVVAFFALDHLLRAIMALMFQILSPLKCPACRCILPVNWRAVANWNKPRRPVPVAERGCINSVCPACKARF